MFLPDQYVLIITVFCHVQVVHPSDQDFCSDRTGAQRYESRQGVRDCLKVWSLLQFVRFNYKENTQVPGERSGRKRDADRGSLLVGHAEQLETLLPLDGRKSRYTN